MKSKEIVGEDYEKICISSINDIFNIFYKCFSSRRIPKGKNLKIRRLPFTRRRGRRTEGDNAV